MKKLLFLLTSIIILAALLLSCDDGSASAVESGAADENDSEMSSQSGQHRHSFETEWSMDEKSHWYVANCGHDLKANLADHVDENKDGACDICLYDGGHEHVFAEEWSHDDANHWRAATCSHAVKADEAAHADENNDSLCDGCGWNYDHEHTYETTWSHDAENHWYAVSCDHTVAEKNKAAHTDENNDGVCDGCAWDYDHTHTYAQEWTHDQENHWHEASCGHSLTSDSESHADENNDSICDGCAWDYDHTHTYGTENDWAINDTYHYHAATCGHDVEGVDMTEHTDADSNRCCDVCGYDFDHVHIYEQAWSWNNENHYHQAACGHSVVADSAPHADANNDSACDVCGWNYGHEHTYATELSHDATHHWYAVTCGHDVAVKDRAPHADANNEGICDSCSWDYDHTHTFDADRWVFAPDTHYHAPTCGHNPVYVRGNEEPHKDDNYDEICDVCGGYISMDAVIDHATSATSASKVNGGTMIYNKNTESIVYASNIFYELGNGYLHMTDRSEYYFFDDDGRRYDETAAWEGWYSTYADGKIFAIVQENENLYRDMGAESVYMNGYYFSGDFISYAMNAYGVEDLVYQLYYLSAGENGEGVSDFVSHYNEENGYYSFMFSFGEINYGVYFVMNSDSVMETVIVTGSENYADMTETDKLYYLKIEQNVGARTVTTPEEYDPSGLLINSFVVKDAQNSVMEQGATLDILAGSTYMITLTVTDILPTTSSSVYDAIDAACADGGVLLYVNNETGEIGINGQKEGTHEVTIFTDHVTFTFNVTVTYPAPTVLKPLVYASGTNYDETESASMFLGGTLNFRASVEENADARYTAVLTGGDAANVTMEASSVEIFGQTYVTTAFTPSAVGTYQVTITSVANPELSATLTITVTEMPPVAEILTGRWDARYSNTTMYTAKFTPESEGAIKGTVEITDRTQASGETQSKRVTVFAYEYRADGIQLTYVSGDENTITLSIGSDSNLVIQGYTMEKRV